MQAIWAIFDEDGSYVEDKRTGERMMMREDGGMFMLKLGVKRKGFERPDPPQTFRESL